MSVLIKDMEMPEHLLQEAELWEAWMLETEKGMARNVY